MINDFQNRRKYSVAGLIEILGVCAIVCLVYGVNNGKGQAKLTMFLYEVEGYGKRSSIGFL